jgi:hypothetical protein
MSLAQRMAALDTAAMAALLLSYIWGWAGQFEGAAYVIVAGYVGIGAFSHVRRSESLRELGIRLDNWRPAALNVLGWMAVPLIVVLAIGAAMHSWHFPSLDRAALRLSWLLIWGTVQQYGLLCFFYRRQREVLGNPVAASVAAAAFFSIFHLPNAFLMVVTLLAGYIACDVYRRQPNVFVMGAMHALTSFILYYALPPGVTHGLRVGPGYYTWGG